MRLGARTAASGDWQCPTCRLASRSRDGLLVMPNNPLIVAAVQALCAGGAGARDIDGGWRQDRGGMPRLDFWSGSGGRIRVRMHAADADEAWRHIEFFSALTLDTATAILAALASDPFRAMTSAPRREAVWLGAPAVLNAKGYRRYGAERNLFAAAVDAEIERVANLRFDIINYPAFDPATRTWRRSGVSRPNVALFQRAHDTAPADPRDCSRGQPLRLGAWAEHWLHASGPMWATSLPQAIVSLDHRDNRGADTLAKKIALLISLNWGAARNAPHLQIELRTLLRRVGELPRPGAGSPRHGGRIADRMEEALLRLSECGVIQSVLHAEKAAALRASGRPWFEEWLNAKVVFVRPAFMNERRQSYQQIANDR